MGDGSKLVRVMTEAGKQSNKDTADFATGKVVSVSPLQINVDDKIQLTEEFLILSPFCIEKVLELGHTHGYNGSTGTAASHSHDYFGTTHEDGPGDSGTFLLWRGLEVGDSVTMLKSNGGQTYYVLQRKEGLE